MKKKKDNISVLHGTKDSGRWVPIPGYARRQGRHRLKHLARQKGNCYFARGVAKGIIDFIHGSIVKLGMGGKTFIFSRGSVRMKGRKLTNSVGIRELSWDVGISIIIPRELKYKTMLRLSIDGEVFTVRLMEVVVLQGLLKIALRGQSKREGADKNWYPSMAAAIIAKGWDELEEEKVPPVVRLLEE